MSEDPRIEAVKTALHICEIRYCIDKIVENEEVTYRVVDTSGEDLEHGYSGHPMGKYSRISDATERRNQLTAECILAAADAAAWRPISEANYKDSQIVAFREGPRGMIDTGEGIHWKDDKWIVDGRAVKPIYFMPLPTPPQEQDT